MTGENEALLAAFLAYESGRGARPRGVKEVRSPARRFLQWLEDGNLAPADLDRRTAKAYLAHLRVLVTGRGENLASRTVLAYAQAAGRLARYLVHRRIIAGNPFAALRRPRSPRTLLRNVLTEAEMEKLLAAVGEWEAAGENGRRQGRRYIAHLVAELQYASGLRIAEVAALELDDVDLEKRRLYVREGKKGKGRVAYLTEYAADLLCLYIDRMRSVVLTGKQAHNGEKLFGCGYEALTHFQNAHLAAAGKKLDMKVTSHGFRHALGYHLLRAGCPLRGIQDILGHEQIKDTEIYTKVDGSAVQEVVDLCHPRGARSLGHAR